eukprot:6060925-Karenia_brevis.AAC.1
MERIAITEKSENRRKRLQGSILVYRKEPPQSQRKLDTSCVNEWKKWIDFSAGLLLERKLLDELPSE